MREENTFGIRLKAILKEKGMTQRMLAQATGMAESTVCRYIDDTRKPCPQNLKKLSETLHVPVNVLTGEETEYEKLKRILKASVSNLTKRQKNNLKRILDRGTE